MGCERLACAIALRAIDLARGRPARHSESSEREKELLGAWLATGGARASASLRGEGLERFAEFGGVEVGGEGALAERPFAEDEAELAVLDLLVDRHQGLERVGVDGRVARESGREVRAAQERERAIEQGLSFFSRKAKPDESAPPPDPKHTLEEGNKTLL